MPASLALVSPRGKREVVEVDLDTPPYEGTGWRFRAPSMKELERTDAPFQSHVFKKERLAYLRVSQIYGREAIELAISSNLGSEEELVPRYFERLGSAPPAGRAFTLAEVPSLLETTTPLLEEMKRDGVKTLVIDLRGNDGGWSNMIMPFLYQLFGDRFFARHWTEKYVRALSVLYLAKYKETVAQVRAEREIPLFEVGDYTLEAPGATTTAAELRASYLRNGKGEPYSFARFVDGQNGQPLFEPRRVVVITDPGTWSAATDFMFLLQQMGAVVVGVPPAQSPNTFMEVTPFTLPRSKLTGSISNLSQLYYPDRPAAREFVVDFPLTYEVAKRYGFAPDASVRHAFDLVKSGAVDRAIAKKEGAAKRGERRHSPMILTRARLRRRPSNSA